MTILTARAILAEHARNANSDEYTSTQYDYAIQAAGNEFVSRTKCVISNATILLAVADDDVVDTDWATDFRPDRLLRAWVRGEPEDLQVVEYREVRRLLTEQTETGTPTMIGFASNTANDAKLWKFPSSGLNIDYQYYAPFLQYTAGTATTSTELNIPDDMMFGVITAGAVFYLQRNMQEHQGYIQSCRRDFEQHILRNMYRANTGVRAARRSMLT